MNNLSPEALAARQRMQDRVAQMAAAIYAACLVARQDSFMVNGELMHAFDGAVKAAVGLNNAVINYPVD